MVGEYTFTAEVLKSDYRASESVEQHSDSISYGLVLSVAVNP